MTFAEILGKKSDLIKVLTYISVELIVVQPPKLEAKYVETL